MIRNKKIQNKNLIKRYLNLIIGCSLLAFAFDVFFAPKNIVYGGVAGVSIVINRLFGIDKSLFVLIVSAILLVISYFTFLLLYMHIIPIYAKESIFKMKY